MKDEMTKEKDIIYGGRNQGKTARLMKQAYNEGIEAADTDLMADAIHHANKEID